MAAPRKPTRTLKPAGAKKRKKRVCARPLAPERVADILKLLAATYPNAECALKHSSAWELLVATILSAQCTDARVNMTTPGLFKKYPTIADVAALTPQALEPEIRSTGFYRNKAKSVTGAARMIMEKFQGQVPDEMDALLTLPGVARKTANVVLGVWFKKASGIVVDTHVHRISNRLQLSHNHAPEKIEADLQKIIPQDQWIGFSHLMIAHGRALCLARQPKCIQCPLEKICCAPDKTYDSR
jgi:endonuclease III